MRITIFDGSFRTTPFINRLVKGLAKNHEVYIVGFNEKIDDKIKNVHYVTLGSNQNKLNFIVTTLAFCFSKRSFPHFFKTFKLLFKKSRKTIQQQNFEIAISQIKPDIIHVQWPSLLPWCESLLLNKKYKIILSQRGSQTNIVPFVNDDNFEYLKKWYPQISGFHSVSKAISEKGDILWDAKSKLDKVIYTGLPLKKITFCNEYLKSTPLILLSVGRAHWVKGYHYALKSCSLLKQAGVDFHYTIVGGDGDEELQYLIDNLKLQDFVRLKKRIPQKKVFKLMRESSLLLMPSLEEGIPNVVVESMAIGLPVVSTDCGGVAELIEDDCTGWVVPSHNPLAMAQAVERFSEMPLGKIKKIRSAARKKVAGQHSESQMIEGIQTLYFETLKSF